MRFAPRRHGESCATPPALNSAASELHCHSTPPPLATDTPLHSTIPGHVAALRVCVRRRTCAKWKGDARQTRGSLHVPMHILAHMSEHVHAYVSTDTPGVYKRGSVYVSMHFNHAPKHVHTHVHTHARAQDPVIGSRLVFRRSFVHVSIRAHTRPDTGQCTVLYTCLYTGGSEMGMGLPLQRRTLNATSSFRMDSSQRGP